nr:uncharacterized aarF domain-containing protein kinase 2-like isoform X1 [Nomia melanderi]
MGFHSNFPRLVRAIRFVRNGRENRQLGKCVDTIQLQRCTAASRMNREGSKRTVETVLILSYHPGRRPMNRIHENDTLTANKDQENLFGAIRNAVLVLTRILVIGSVVIGLAAAYFITRFTRCHVFPSILLKDGMMNDRGEGGIREEDPRCSRLEPVAIKILHPGIKEQLRRDLSIMRGVCKCVTYVVPELYWLSLTDCIDEFSRIMENQVDMNREAGNLMKFSRNFSGKKDVVFPQPYVNFTQREILVESFHEGSTILDFVGYEDDKLQEKLAKIGIKMMLKMVFRDNFIHCDLHPGNILVETKRESIGGMRAWLWRFIDRDHRTIYPRLIILDCGLVVSLDDRCQRNLKDVFRSVLMGNGELAAEHILEHSSHTCPDPDGFKNTLRGIVDDHLRNRTDMNVTTIVSELFSAMVRHRVKQDGSFSSVILSMAMIEGLGRNLYPNIDIFTEVLPFLFT